MGLRIYCRCSRVTEHGIAKSSPTRHIPRWNRVITSLHLHPVKEVLVLSQQFHRFCSPHCHGRGRRERDAAQGQRPDLSCRPVSGSPRESSYLPSSLVPYWRLLTWNPFLVERMWVIWKATTKLKSQSLSPIVSPT